MWGRMWRPNDPHRSLLDHRTIPFGGNFSPGTARLLLETIAGLGGASVRTEMALGDDALNIVQRFGAVGNPVRCPITTQRNGRL